MFDQFYQRSKKTEKGFTLVEVLVAMLIIFIMVMAFVPMYEYILQAMNSNKYRQAATGLANSVMEEMRALPYIVKNSNGQVVTSSTTPQLGIKGGNPPGSIPATQSRDVDGKTYTIKTRVYWVAKGSNPVAYKRVKVEITSPNAFKGNVTVSSDFYTLAAQEGEADVFKAGHVAVHIRNKDGVDWESPEVQINLHSASIDEDSYTEDGKTLFGILPAGYYTVSAKLPGELVTRPDLTLNSGWIEQKNIQVSDLTTTDVYFDMDYPSKIRLTMKDDASDESIRGNGILTLNWNGTALSPITFKENNFSGSYFSPGNLWPGGTYSISLSDVMDSSNYKAYYLYDMATAPGNNKPKSGGSDWDGTLGDAGSTVNVSIDLTSALKAHLIADESNIETVTDDDGNVRVTQWQDLSGYSNNAAQIGANPCPLWADNAVVRFSGSERLQFINDSGCQDNFTILAVVKASGEHEIDTQSTSGIGGVNNQKYLFWPNWGNVNNAGEGISMGTNGISNYEYGDNYMPATAVYEDTIDDLNTIGVKYTNKQPFIYLNGIKVTTGLKSNRGHVFSPTDIGGGAYGYFSGDVMEILVYDASLNDANMELVNSYLDTKR